MGQTHPWDNGQENFIRAAQSERILVVIGSEESHSLVPQDLISGCSPKFRELCEQASNGSAERYIRLADVRPSVFNNFFIWLHSFPRKIDVMDVSHAIDLAVFADTYQINQLKNQSSDMIMECLSSGKYKPTPEAISLVYGNMPDGSKLQDLFSLAFTILHTRQSASHAPPLSDYMQWKDVFERFANFGRDFFRHSQGSLSKLDYRGSCTYHDHTDVPGWGTQNPARRSRCPDSNGKTFQLSEPWVEDGSSDMKLVEDGTDTLFRRTRDGKRSKKSSKSISSTQEHQEPRLMAGELIVGQETADVESRENLSLLGSDA